MPYEYMMPYNPPCKLDLLWPWVMASHFYCYSCDTASNSHMIMCEFHQLLFSWMNLGLMATHYNCFPSPCWVQCISIVTSLSGLLLYPLIVVLSAEAEVLKRSVSTMTMDSVFCIKSMYLHWIQQKKFSPTTSLKTVKLLGTPCKCYPLLCLTSCSTRL